MKCCASQCCVNYNNNSNELFWKLNEWFCKTIKHLPTVRHTFIIKLTKWNRYDMFNIIYLKKIRTVKAWTTQAATWLSDCTDNSIWNLFDRVFIVNLIQIITVKQRAVFEPYFYWKVICYINLLLYSYYTRYMNWRVKTLC